jgi:hypothetical protein
MQQLPLHLKYAQCHTFIYTITTVPMTCYTLRPYTVQSPASRTFRHTNMDDSRLSEVPGDVIDHDSRLNKKWE